MTPIDKFGDLCAMTVFILVCFGLFYVAKKLIHELKNAPFMDDDGNILPPPDHG